MMPIREAIEAIHLSSYFREVHMYDPKVKPTEIDVNEMALVHDPGAEAAKYYKDEASSCCYG